MGKLILNPRTKDLTGQKRFFLTVESFAGYRKWKGWWNVVCDCGKRKIISTENFGVTKSCGCWRDQRIKETATKHGMAGTPIFCVWKTMRARCNNPRNGSYANYGSRGITVCDRWKSSFENFLADMGATYRNGLSLERVDNDGDYSPENCVWADSKTQGRNKRSNRYIDTPSGRMLLVEAAELSGIKRETLADRIEHGWPASRLFYPPKKVNFAAERHIETPDGRMRLHEAAKRSGIGVATLRRRSEAGWPASMMFERPENRKRTFSAEHI
ncbi:MAG: hypothetical protein LBE24_03970 [Methylobacillus sp.]|nr:hypothetical protein [Methylobacillus sp.]